MTDFVWMFLHKQKNVDKEYFCQHWTGETPLPSSGTVSVVCSQWCFLFYWDTLSVVSPCPFKFPIIVFQFLYHWLPTPPVYKLFPLLSASSCPFCLSCFDIVSFCRRVLYLDQIHHLTYLDIPAWM